MVPQALQSQCSKPQQSPATCNKCRCLYLY